MSYILEALQKSEHARQRGKVPDLNTTPETTAGPHGPAAAQRPPYVAVAAAFAITLAAAVLGWWRPWQAAEPQPPAPPHAPAPMAPVEPRALPAVAPPPQTDADTSPHAKTDATPPAPQALPVAPPLAAAATPPTASVTAVAAQSPAPAPVLEPLVPVRPRSVAAAPAGPTAVSTEPAAAVAKTRRDAAPPDTPAPSAPAIRKESAGRTLNIHELPPSVRSSLPPLTISGYASTGDSGKWILVINNRLVQEGEEAEPGVTLTKVEDDGVLFDFQGYRFRIKR